MSPPMSRIFSTRARTGELRVRAIAGEDPAGREPGAPPGGAVRALAGAALSLVTVPLVVDGLVTGVLAVAAAEPDRFGGAGRGALAGSGRLVSPVARAGQAGRA